MNEILFYGGIAVAGVSVVVGIIVAIILWISKHRLNTKLDEEYGKLK